MSSARIVTGGDIFKTQAVQEGRVFIQDEASQLVAALVGHGSRLLDCCAAPGGKTAAMAARNPTAEIIAAELHAHRAELLRKRVPRENVQVIQADALNLPTARKLRSRSRRCALLRHWHARAQSGDQVAAEA